MLATEWTADAAWTTSAGALAELGALAEELMALAEACVGAVLADDRRLEILEVAEPARGAIRRSWQRRYAGSIIREDRSPLSNNERRCRSPPTADDAVSAR